MRGTLLELGEGGGVVVAVCVLEEGRATLGRHQVKGVGGNIRGLGMLGWGSLAGYS